LDEVMKHSSQSGEIWYGGHRKFPAGISIYLDMEVIINSLQIYRYI
jgi:hypothetical protein